MIERDFWRAIWQAAWFVGRERMSCEENMAGDYGLV